MYLCVVYCILCVLSHHLPSLRINIGFIVFIYLSPNILQLYMQYCFLCHQLYIQLACVVFVRLAYSRSNRLFHVINHSIKHHLNPLRFNVMLLSVLRMCIAVLLVAFQRNRLYYCYQLGYYVSVYFAVCYY